jgi:outer membrane lipoprotein-sorting protein
MIEPSCPIRPTRRLVPSPRAGVCLSSAAAVVCLGVFSTWLGRASAQQTPPSGVPVPAGAPASPSGGPAADAQGKEKAEEVPTSAELLIDDAKAKVAKLKSCSADLEEKVDMLNQRHLTLTGRYLKAPQYRVYFRLAVSGLPETSGTTLQVCDGETLWDYQAILEQQGYHKFSIKPVMERLNSPELDVKIREQIKEGLGFAGPETLLSGVRRVFRFEQDKEEGKLGEKPVWILRGVWRRESRQGLTGPDQRQVSSTGMLPPYIPGLAVLYLGKDDGFPYKLELRGQKPTVLFDTRKRGPDGRPIGSRSSIESVEPTNITLEYTNVKLNPELNLDEFAFQAHSAASVEDGTEMIVKQLDTAIAMQAERKKAEAAKKEGPVLDRSLDITPPPGLPPVDQQPPKP